MGYAGHGCLNTSRSLAQLRQRPLLMGTKEKHSEELRASLRAWSGVVSRASPPDPNANLGYTDQGEFTLEGEILFRDLRQHIPPEFHTFERWESLKKDRHAYDVRRNALYGEMVKHVDTATGHGLGRYLAAFLYSDAIAVARNERPSHRDRKSEIRETSDAHYLFGFGMVLLDQTTETEAKNIWGRITTMFENLTQPGTPESQFVADTKELLAIKDQLDAACGQLTREIDELLAIPILPGDCKHIKRATGSLFSFLPRLPVRVPATEPEADSPKLLKWGIMCFSLSLVSWGLGLTPLMWVTLGLSFLLMVLGLDLGVKRWSNSPWKQRFDSVGQKMVGWFSPSASFLYVVLFSAGFLAKLQGQRIGLTLVAMILFAFVWMLVFLLALSARLTRVGWVIAAAVLLTSVVYLALDNLPTGLGFLAMGVVILLGMVLFKRLPDFP